MECVITAETENEVKTKTENKVMKTKTKAKTSETKNDKLSDIYQKKTDIEHILDAPDTYIGSVEKDEIIGWNISSGKDEKECFDLKKYNIIPGLYKLYDEGIVNCRDHHIRMAEKIKACSKKPNKIDDTGNHVNQFVPVTSIDIEVDKESGKITMTNNGNGIDVAKHPEHKLWIPEMIFGHLRTSTNYKKSEKKIVGGKNGFGFKLVLIYSTWGRIETVDHVRGKRYIQEFGANLSEIHKPKITTTRKAKPYTKVSWIPDYKRFGVEGLSDEMFNLFKRRAYDIAAVTDKSVRVKFNGKTLPSNNFEQYIDMHSGAFKDEETGEPVTKIAKVYEKPDKCQGRWEYAVSLTPTGEFCQVSMVNGVYTSKGGKHVNYILNQIVKKISAYIFKKKKIKVKDNTIKEQLALYLNCIIENPSFDSQTKDFLTTSSAKFGSKCEVSNKFIEKIVKMGVMENAISLTTVKDQKAAFRTDGKQVVRIKGIPKLIDANNAGTKKNSMYCILILCEGDSAKAGIVSGLTREHRDYVGVFPLKGKIMNTFGVSQKKINDNDEIKYIKQILGINTKKKFKTPKALRQSLRYGSVVFMTDQDLDGIHIKGLGINLFSSQWPNLFKLDRFIGYMNTPILKAKKGKKEKNFYNESEYKKWRAANNDGKGWAIKYYKGLGTSTAKEFREYFAKMKIIYYNYNEENSDESIDKVFNKKRADDRKLWLKDYDRSAIPTITSVKEKITKEEFKIQELLMSGGNKKSKGKNSKSKVKVKVTIKGKDSKNKGKNVVVGDSVERFYVAHDEFIDQEFRHFSKYDCERSIANLVDGLKTSQRKILFSCFKRNLVREIKVAQLAGYVSEHSGYHHGEMSLNHAIKGMAQEYPGSNNVALLMPNGQFGSRLGGGKDSASERYIFTKLNPIAKFIYPEEDFPVLNYLDDDGTPVEPDFYVPIVPMVLVNGGKGIGTAFSYDIMSHNLSEIIDYLKYDLKYKIHHKITNNSEMVKKNKKKIHPYYEGFKGEIIRVEEHKYLFKGKYDIVGTDLVEITELPIGSWTDDYKATLEGLSDSKKHKNPIVKAMQDMSTDVNVEFKVKLASGKAEYLLPKIVEYDCNNLEKKLKLFTTRKTSNMHLFDAEQKIRKFDTIYEIINEFYKVRYDTYVKRKAHQIEIMTNRACLVSNKARFIKEQCDDVIDLRKKKKTEVVALLRSRNYDKISGDNEYKYLRSMPIDSLIEENIEKLNKEAEKIKSDLEILKITSVEQLWLYELNLLKEEFEKYKKERNKRNQPAQ